MHQNHDGLLTSWPRNPEFGGDRYGLSVSVALQKLLVRYGQGRQRRQLGPRDGTVRRFVLRQRWTEIRNKNYGHGENKTSHPSLSASKSIQIRIFEAALFAPMFCKQLLFHQAVLHWLPTGP